MTDEDKYFECRILRDHSATCISIAGNEESLKIYKNKFDTLVKEKNVPGFQISKIALSGKIWGKTKIMLSLSSNEISRDSSGNVTEDDNLPNEQKAGGVEKHESNHPEKESQKPYSDKNFIRSLGSTPQSVRRGRGNPFKHPIPVIRKQPEGKFVSYEEIIASKDKKIEELRASKKGLKATIAQNKELTKDLEAQNKELTKELEAQKQQMTKELETQKQQITKELEAQKQQITKELEAQNKELTKELEAQKQLADAYKGTRKGLESIIFGKYNTKI